MGGLVRNLVSQKVFLDLRPDTVPQPATLTEARAVDGATHKTFFADGSNWTYTASDISSLVVSGVFGIAIGTTADTTGASGGWLRQYERILPKHFGAIGDGATDDTTALNNWISIVKLYSQYTLVGGLSSRNLKRLLDLEGKVYKVSSTVNLLGAPGCSLTNGTLIADSGATWSGAPVIKIASSSFGAEIYDVTVQCNHATNGILIESNGNAKVRNSRVYGWGKFAYGVRASPTGYSQDVEISDNKVQGWKTEENDILQAETTAIGIDIQCNDSFCHKNTVSHGLYQIKLSGGGWLVTENHLYSGYNISDAVDVLIDSSGGGTLSDNYIDNGCIRVNASVLYKNISDNYFLSNKDTVTACIILAPTSAGQTFADFLCQGNRGSGPYDKFIKIDTTNGTFTAVNRGLVRDNVIRSTLSGYGAYPASYGITEGSVRFTAAPANFNGSTQIVLDLNNVLLLPGATNPLMYSISLNPSTLTTVSVTASSYNSSTGKLTITCSATFTGNIKIDVDQSLNFKALTPDTP